MQIHIRIFAPKNLSHPPSEKTLRDSQKQHSPFVHHLSLNGIKYLRYSISDTTNQWFQLSRNKLNINSGYFVLVVRQGTRGQTTKTPNELGHAMTGALKEPSLSLACSSNM